MSARARTALLVAVLAAVAGAVVAGATVLSAKEVGGPSSAQTAPQPRAGFPPLVLSLGIREDDEARQLLRAVDLYARGKRQQAARIFARYDSLEAKLGAAFAAWPASLDRVEQLGALYPRSALVQLHVGYARFWAGTGDAVVAWREARDVEPDTPYAVRADDVLHGNEFAPGLPSSRPASRTGSRARRSPSSWRRCAPTGASGAGCSSAWPISGWAASLGAASLLRGARARA